MSNVQGGKSTPMSYGNTESGSVNEEQSTRTKKVITATDSEGNLIYPKARKGEYSTTGKP